MVTPKRKPRTGLTTQDNSNSPTNDILTAIPSDDSVMMAETSPSPAHHTSAAHVSDSPSEGPPPLPSMLESQPTIDDILSLPPAQENEWPHGLLAPYEPSSPKEIAFGAHVAPNGGFFPQATIPLERALLGIGPTQQKAILDGQDSTILLIVFNGGRTLFSGTEDKIGSVIRAKLEEMTDSRDFEIYQPISVLDDKPGPDDDMGHLRIPPSKDDKYAPPYTFIATNLPYPLRQFLIEIQTIGFAHSDRTYGFHALPVDDTVRSWVVGIYSSTVPANSNASTSIRKAIVLHLASDNAFRQKIGQARLTSTSLDKLVVEILGTLSVRPIPGYAKGKEGYLVCVAPFTNDPVVFDNVKSHIQAKTFVHGLFQVTPWTNPAARGGEMVVCVICKLDTHHTHSCPFHNMKDWWGPSSHISNDPQSGSQTMRGSSSGGPSRRGSKPYGRGGQYMRGG